jgi:predicted AlkP superfamily pyrophosphatase or phosphodiesterase
MTFRLLAALALALSLVVAGCTGTPAPQPIARAVVAEQRPPVTLLISIDGFRPDYLQRGVTPNLNALAGEGISAAMRPSFPSKTFPNHWTLVTGLRPDRNGIVANRMLDPAIPGKVFTMATDDARWWSDAQPIWIAAEQAGIRTATMFWPGSNVLLENRRPADWVQFNENVSNAQRVNTLLDWLRRPAAERPRLLTAYFDVVDHEGHEHGPDSPEVTRAAAEVDAAIGRLRAGLAELGQPANLVVVADHGMAALSPERVVRLDSFASAADYTLVEDGPFVTLNPQPGHEAALAAGLAHPPAHVACWAKGAIPARLHYGSHRRVPAYLCLADVGWQIMARESRGPAGGTHGYDNDAPEMRALFIAAGPSFRAGGPLQTFDNVDVEPLLRDLLGLPAGKDRDGDDAPFRAVLKR